MVPFLSHVQCYSKMGIVAQQPQMNHNGLKIDAAQKQMNTTRAPGPDSSMVFYQWIGKGQISACILKGFLVTTDLKVF